MIHGHGDDIYGHTETLRANFSTNVWYGSDNQELRKTLFDAFECTRHYPEPDAASFRGAVAQFHGLTPQQVVAGNGATELFYLVAQCFEGANTVIPVPSFAEYEDACRLFGHQLTWADSLGFENRPLPPKTTLLFLCNPNNPDGKWWTVDWIKQLLTQHPELHIVVDEAFIDFCPNAISCTTLLAKFENLIVIRSMTKSYAIPGLRLGYLLGTPALVERLLHYKQPWSVNALAITAGVFCLENSAQLLPDLETITERRNRFQSQIQKIRGFHPLPTQSSFFLVHTEFNSTALKEYLLQHDGLLIRDAANFRGLDAHYFRLNTLTDAKNTLLLNALASYANAQS